MATKRLRNLLQERSALDADYLDENAIQQLIDTNIFKKFEEEPYRLNIERKPIRITTSTKTNPEQLLKIIEMLVSKINDLEIKMDHIQAVFMRERNKNRSFLKQQSRRVEQFSVSKFEEEILSLLRKRINKDRIWVLEVKVDKIRDAAYKVRVFVSEHPPRKIRHAIFNLIEILADAQNVTVLIELPINDEN